MKPLKRLWVGEMLLFTAINCGVNENPVELKMSLTHRGTCPSTYVIEVKERLLQNISNRFSHGEPCGKLFGIDPFL